MILAIRVICIALFAITLATAAAFLAHMERGASLKLLGISGVLIAIAARPTELPFFSKNAAALLFYRNAFLTVAAVLLGVSIFIVGWIQIPHERLPRFEGTVIRSVDVEGQRVPEVKYRDPTGAVVVFDDRLANVRFPGRIFTAGEKVPVLAMTRENTHIDHTFLSRWDAAIFLAILTITVFACSAVCHVRAHMFWD
ncbi:hypothetical protein CR51_31210 [Caballeronia megalochromosomata]|nr:hypothetical protein CR51_31210 [Caballeronia megalochromosomata]